MNTLQICPPHLSDVATLRWEIQKSHFSTLLFIYFRSFTLSQKKRNSNCCTAALAIYLHVLLFIVHRRSPSTASAACYRRSAYIDMNVLRQLRPFAAVVCCDMGWISAQHGVGLLCDWPVSKKTWKHVLLIFAAMSQQVFRVTSDHSLWTLAVTLLAWHSSCHTS